MGTEPQTIPNGKTKYTGTKHDDILDGHEVKNGIKIYGEDGNDTIYGAQGNTSIYGGAGHDYLKAGIGNTKMYGDAGNDILIGGVGNDSIYGGAGNDTIVGSAGNDVYDLGSGKNVVDYTGVLSGSDSVPAFTQTIKTTKGSTVKYKRFAIIRRRK